MGGVSPVDRAACRSLESQFIGRFLRRLKEIKLLHNPLANAAVDTEGGVLRESSDEIEVKAAVRRHAPPDSHAAAFEAMPRNMMVTVEYSRRRLFGSRRPLVAAAAVAVNPLEELARDERSSTPAGADRLSAVLQRILVNPRVFYYVIAFSPTGWDAAARAHCLSQNAVVALASPQAGGVRVLIPESGGPISRKAFDLMTYLEKFRMLQSTIVEHGVELVLGDFTEDFVAEMLHFDRGIIESLFEDAVAEDPFLILDNRRAPIRLLREYSRPAFPSLRAPAEESELVAVRDAAARDNARIQCMQQDLDLLARREEELLERGAKAPERARNALAHALRRLRHKQKEVSIRLDVLQKRYRILTGYLTTLEQLRTARAEQVPDPERLETMMARAGVARDQLKELADLAEAASPQPDPETEEQLAGILREIESPAPETRESEAPEDPKQRPKEREPDEDEGMLLES
jgi:hypothetical protein